MDVIDLDEKGRKLEGILGMQVHVGPPMKIEFKDLSRLDIVGMYPNYREALAAWRAKAQATVDNAHMRYFVVHIHRLMEPEGEA